jgi:hypothetical protein
MKISGFIFGGLAKIMDFDFVPRNVIVSESKNVSEPEREMCPWAISKYFGD